MHIFTDDFTLIFGPCTTPWITGIVAKVGYGMQSVVMTSADERAKRWYDYSSDRCAIVNDMTPTTLDKLCEMLSKYRRKSHWHLISVSYSDQLEILDLIVDVLY